VRIAVVAVIGRDQHAVIRTDARDESIEAFDRNVFDLVEPVQVIPGAAD
jgi:hypothetical protein